ncbi:MAG: cytochrome c oxidase assembly protein, partial [Pseudomonadota bacterium]
LQPGEKASMPVAYFIDPAIDDDPNLDEVETVTLSYTFYRLDAISPSDTEASAASALGESD